MRIRGETIVVSALLAVLAGFSVWPYLNSSALPRRAEALEGTLYRFTSVLEFREHDRVLGNLTSVFSIVDVGEDTVDMLLTVSFTSSDVAVSENPPIRVPLIKDIALRMVVSVWMWSQPAISLSIPLGPIKEYSLRSGETVTLTHETYNLSRFDKPEVVIQYVISPIELRFLNGSTVLLERFSTGQCRVMPGATLATVEGVIWPIAPLWEGDYTYSPGAVLTELAELKGRDVWRRIAIDIAHGSYRVDEIVLESLDTE